MRVATVAWKIRPAKRDSRYFGHFYDLVSAAHDEGAQVVVLPELHVLEMLPMAPEIKEKDAAKYLAQYADAVEGWIARISTSSDMIIVGGSHFRQTEDGIKNVCAIGVPHEGVVLAEKNNLTTYESVMWRMAPGTGLVRLPEQIGVTICYDSEFPEAGRALAESGTLVQCVPAWTETQRGFQRVRWSCLARAVENQVFVVHSSLVGDLGKEPVPVSYGSSAIISPSIEPFPVEAVLRETPLNEEGVVVADLDFDMLEEARAGGEVTNWEDRFSGTWNVQDGSEAPHMWTNELNVNGELN
ncbi:MAG TPA: nitrilase-related carbon-nitrogen hydrolase [Fimbriimonas sp.]